VLRFPLAKEPLKADQEIMLTLRKDLLQHDRSARYFGMEYAEGEDQYFHQSRWRGGLKETAAPSRPGLAALGHERREALASSSVK